MSVGDLSVCTLTVFTATYNRGHLIERLYRSLQRQNCFDFEWLVVDDGSQDKTSELFSTWLAEENPFPIRYYRQENKGLIGALNRGIELASGQYFAKIDSDDYVVDDYIESIMNWLDGIRDAEDVYAVSGVRVKPDGTPIKGCWPQIPDVPGYVDATDLERSRYDLDADMSEAWRTDILREYGFPVWPGEKFAPEQLTLFKIALDGWKIRWYPKAICICEYQENGLTLGASKLEKQNPMGYAMMYNQYILLQKRFSQKLRNAMQMTALASYAGHLEYLRESNSKLATMLSFPVGMLLGLRRKHQYSKIK